MRKKKKITHRHTEKDTEVMALERIVGENVKLYRKLRNITQGKLARLCRVQQASISNLEAGKRGFSSTTIIRVAAALKVHPAALFLPPVEGDSSET